MEDVKGPVPGQLTPWGRISEHIRSLDESLATISGYTEESKITRQYIVGQIDALKWAMKFWDVG